MRAKFNKPALSLLLLSAITTCHGMLSRQEQEQQAQFAAAAGIPKPTIRQRAQKLWTSVRPQSPTVPRSNSLAGRVSSWPEIEPLDVTPQQQINPSSFNRAPSNAGSGSEFPLQSSFNGRYGWSIAPTGINYPQKMESAQNTLNLLQRDFEESRRKSDTSSATVIQARYNRVQETMNLLAQLSDRGMQSVSPEALQAQHDLDLELKEAIMLCKITRSRESCQKIWTLFEHQKRFLDSIAASTPN